jgi:hypothetical protein
LVVVGTAVFVPRTDLDRHSTRGVGATLRKGVHTSPQHSQRSCVYGRRRTQLNVQIMDEHGDSVKALVAQYERHAAVEKAALADAHSGCALCSFGSSDNGWMVDWWMGSLTGYVCTVSAQGQNTAG